MTEKITIQLPDLLIHCPSYWQNFIDEWNRVIRGVTRTEADAIFENMCLEYNMAFCEDLIDNPDPAREDEICMWLEFADEQAFMWFKLRWS